MEIRAFLAFELPSDMRKEVFRISGEVKKSGLGAGWVKPANIHLTVVFLGDVNEKDIPAIIYSVGNVTGKHEAFDVSLGGVGLFPDTGRPRVLWLGLEGETERLALLRDDLQKPLEAFGVKKEKRPFSPHLTLGRFRRPVKEKSLLKKILDEHGDISGPGGKLEKLILFKSDLKPTGAEYSKLNSWSFRT